MRKLVCLQGKGNKVKTILVSGASGIVGYGILRTLKGWGYRLIGTTIYEDSPAECFSDIVEMVPVSTDINYICFLKSLIIKYQVDMIIPGIEFDMLIWNKHRDELEKTGAFVLLNNRELVSLCLDKWRFFEKLEENQIDCRIESSNEADFYRFKTPFILKPRCGYGSKGVVKINSKEKFEQKSKEIGEILMMQEYVGSDEAEYTVSAFFTSKSKLKAMIGMKRKLAKAGYTETAEVVNSEPFRPIIQELAEVFCPIGPTNFQFRKHADSWKLLEINPRISSSTSIKAAFGYNESKMSIDYFLEGKEIEQPNIKYGKAIRYIEDYIVYDSDIV